MSGRGIFNKLVDTFHSVADDARAKLAPKDGATAQTAGAAATTGAAESEAARAERLARQGSTPGVTDSATESMADSARRVASDSGRQAGIDHIGGVASDSAVECRFCRTPNEPGTACSGCGATPDR
jgi:hypothetical protein